MKGDVPRKWSSKRKFSNDNIHRGPLDVPCICGPCIMHGHFVTFVLCPEYYTFLDPLTDEYVIDPNIHENAKNVIKKI